MIAYEAAITRTPIAIYPRIFLAFVRLSSFADPAKNMYPTTISPRVTRNPARYSIVFTADLKISFSSNSGRSS